LKNQAVKHKKMKNNQSGATPHQFWSMFFVLISSSIYSQRKEHLPFLSLLAWNIRYVNLRVPPILLHRLDICPLLHHHELYFLKIKKNYI